MIGLVDCNNFFVSCERIFEPALEGKPVAILSNNDGVVVARSKELKALGIPMGEPYFRLKPLEQALGLVFKSSNYALYADISRRVMSLLHEEAPMVEQYSIDEAFIYLVLKNSDYFAFAKELRRKLRQWIGMPVGIGFAATRTLAKIANHAAKKSQEGVFILEKPGKALLSTTPVEEIWGVGRRFAKRLREIGIADAWALANMDADHARRYFNVCLLRTIQELNGIQATLFEDYDAPTQSVTCSRAFGTAVTSLEELRESIADYAEKAAAKMRVMGRKATGCNVYFAFYPDYALKLDAGYAGQSILFRRPTSNTSEALSQIFPLLPGLFQSGRRYKKSGITFWGLDKEQGEQLDLFQKNPEPAIPDAAYKAIDAINAAYGRSAIHTLAEGTDKNWRMKRNLLTRRYTTNWNELPIVH